MPEITIQEALQIGRTHYNEGRLLQAEVVYRRILEHSPNDPEALHQLGIIAHRAGQNDAALELIQRAIKGAPQRAEFYCNLGVVLGALGRLEEAMGWWRHTLTLNPFSVDALHNLARALDLSGRTEEAVDCWKQVLTFRPEWAEIYSHLGVVRARQHRHAEAIELFQEAVKRNPGNAESLYHLGCSYWEEKRYDEARDYLLKALEARPNWSPLYTALADVARVKRQWVEARAYLDRALALDPNLPDTYHSLGLFYRDQGMLEEAVGWLQKAVERGGSADWRSDLGTTLHELARAPEALANLDSAVALNPGEARLHFNRSLVLLLLGRMTEGWQEYAWRLQCQELAFLNRDFPQPVWRGEDLREKRILLHAEQGFGDAIQFVRYASMVAQRAKHVMVECQGSLVRLLSSAPGVSQTLEKGSPLPAFDYQISMMDLPGVFGTTLETIPGHVPYLQVPQDRLEPWRKRVAEAMAGHEDLRVGLAWAGNPENSSEGTRTIPVQCLSSLGDVPGVRIFSLQMDPGAQGSCGPLEKLRLINLMDQVRDFADTGALLSHLDLIIGADTSVVHLAGALARPVWTLLSFCPDWRWQLGRPDTPWYPTMRLFRQTTRGDWNAVIGRVAEELRNKSVSRGPK